MIFFFIFLCFSLSHVYILYVAKIPQQETLSLSVSVCLSVCLLLLNGYILTVSMCEQAVYGIAASVPY